MSWWVGLAVTVAVLAARGPAGRPVRAVVRGTAGARRSGTRGGPTGRVAMSIGRGRGPDREGERDLAVVVTEVAARLRAGADPGAAWQGALGRPVPPAGPAVGDLTRSATSRSPATAVVVAGRLAAILGSPLAPLLDGVAEQLAAQAEAEGERRAALAGPRATARVLTWLPALGVLLGTAVGADPLAVLMDGSIGSAALAVGMVLLLLGRAWTARLARTAAAAGTEA